MRSQHSLLTHCLNASLCLTVQGMGIEIDTAVNVPTYGGKQLDISAKDSKASRV